MNDPSFNFHHELINRSPKKLKTQRKKEIRLFCNDKKIPKWAADMKKVKNEALYQQKYQNP